MSIATSSKTFIVQQQQILRNLTQFVLALLRETRLVIVAIYVARCAAAIALLPHDIFSATYHSVALTVVSLLLAVVAIYVYNGLQDLAGDRMNKSRRPLASGMISETQARAAVAWAATGSLVISAVASLATCACIAALLALGYAYSGGPFPLKRFGGFALFVAGAGAAIPYVAISLAAQHSLSTTAGITAVLLGAWVWAGGATKDLSDVAGDAASGRKTAPVKLGTKAAQVLIVLQLFALSGVAVTAVALGMAPVGFVAMPAGAVLLLAVAVARRLNSQDRTRSDSRRLYRVFMSTQFGLNGLLVLSSAFVA